MADAKAAQDPNLNAIPISALIRVRSYLPFAKGYLSSPGVACYAKLGIPFLLAFALLVCWIAPGWCATNMTLSRPNAGAAPIPVNVYLYLVDVFEVSGSDQAFSADVVLIAEWRDPNLAGKSTAIQSAKLEDVWEPRLQVVNQRGASILLPQRVEIHPDGLVRYRQRWSGRFTARMDLKGFSPGSAAFSRPGRKPRVLARRSGTDPRSGR